MPLESYDQLYQRACERKGGSARVEAKLHKPLTNEQLATVGDDRFLAEFTKKVFQSGFVWRVVEQKWSHFEALFFQFDPEKILLMSDEMLEQRAQDPSIIRNLNKVMTIRGNAMMIQEVRHQHGSFARFIANWPSSDIMGLWQYLKKCGVRLGGNTGPYSLRAIGKDTPLLTTDVCAYFKNQSIISGGVNSKRSMTALQQAFNQLQQQSGRSLSEISQIIAYSVNDNHQ